MIRHVRAVGLRVRKIGLVATVTIGCRVTGGVVAAQVAVRTSIDHRPNRTRNSRARWQHVWTLEREPRRRVVKLSV